MKVKAKQQVKRSQSFMRVQAQLKKRDPKKFDYSLNYKKLDLRRNPELYRVGVGEQGVLLVEPYKSEILPFWKFSNPNVARKSAETLFKIFTKYKKAGDFVGMDMARKFLQMGFTRSRRYANHRSGRKYGAKGEVLDFDPDPIKAQSAEIFLKLWKKAEADKEYYLLKKQFKQNYG